MPSPVHALSLLLACLPARSPPRRRPRRTRSSTAGTRTPPTTPRRPGSQPLRAELRPEPQPARPSHPPGLATCAYSARPGSAGLQRLQPGQRRAGGARASRHRPARRVTDQLRAAPPHPRRAWPSSALGVRDHAAPVPLPRRQVAAIFRASATRTPSTRSRRPWSARASSRPTDSSCGRDVQPERPGVMHRYTSTPTATCTRGGNIESPRRRRPAVLPNYFVFSTSFAARSAATSTSSSALPEPRDLLSQRELRACGSHDVRGVAITRPRLPALRVRADCYRYAAHCPPRPTHHPPLPTPTLSTPPSFPTRPVRLLQRELDRAAGRPSALASDSSNS